MGGTTYGAKDAPWFQIYGLSLAVPGCDFMLDLQMSSGQCQSSRKTWQDHQETLLDVYLLGAPIRYTAMRCEEKPSGKQIWPRHVVTPWEDALATQDVDQIWELNITLDFK
eukprot:2800700-Amphidinium_carterae.1